MKNRNKMKEESMIQPTTRSYYSYYSILVTTMPSLYPPLSIHNATIVLSLPSLTPLPPVPFTSRFRHLTYEDMINLEPSFQLYPY